MLSRWKAFAPSDPEPYIEPRVALESAVPKFPTILVAVALDGTDGPLVRFIEQLAERWVANLVLLHVVPEVSEGLLTYGLPGGSSRPLATDLANEKLRQLSQNIAWPHLTSVVTGSERRCIAKAVKKHRADLIVTGRRA